MNISLYNKKNNKNKYKGQDYLSDVQKQMEKDLPKKKRIPKGPLKQNEEKPEKKKRKIKEIIKEKEEEEDKKEDDSV